MAATVKVKMTAEEKIAALQKKIQQVKALDEKQKVKELSDVLKHSTAQETRKKILVGSFAMSNSKDPLNLTLKEKKFSDSLIRDDDRALFGLPPLPKDVKDAARVRNAMDAIKSDLANKFAK